MFRWRHLVLCYQSHLLDLNQKSYILMLTKSLKHSLIKDSICVAVRCNWSQTFYHVCKVASSHKILHKIGFTRTGFRQLQHVVVSKKTVYKCYFIHFASHYVRKFARSYQTFDFRSTSFRLLHHNVKQRLPISVYVQHQLPCNPGIPRNPMSPLIPASPLTPV